MILDAPTYKLVLTPEAAMGIVQKELARRGWRKFEIENVRLVYTPYYTFSFDVSAETAGPITGKAALNAYTGDVDEFVPMLLERPLDKLKKAEDNAEIEETSVPKIEAKGAARDKIAVQTAVKRDRVSVSAINKVYIPYYRIWVNLPTQQLRAQVDALVGSVVGLEGVHAKPKTFGESARDTVKKLASPSGIAELGGKAVGSIAGGKGGGSSGSPFERKEFRWAGIGLVILVLLYLTTMQGSPDADCSGTITQVGMECKLEGECGFNNPKAEQDYVTAHITIYQKGIERPEYGSIVGLLVDSKGKPDAWRKTFEVTWESEGLDCEKDFSWKAGKI
ncbi:hypothetical protein KJ765_05870 [Candidatus Micrarchaeota archaeon]|nr:hypothetical protein [Candidatus Micrarchaeota archaeon]